MNRFLVCRGMRAGAPQKVVSWFGSFNLVRYFTVFSAKSYRLSVCGFGGNDGHIAGSALLLKIICHFRVLGLFFCTLWCCEVMGSAFISMQLCL